MRGCLFIILAMYAFGLGAFFCDEPFPARIYDEAKSEFIRLHHLSLTSFDKKESVALHKLILNGFDESLANALSPTNNKEAFLRTPVGAQKVAAVHVAAMMGNLDALKWLLKHGADINARDRRGFTPAHFSALNRSSECLEFLVEAKAQIHLTNEFGATSDQLWHLTHLADFTKQRIYFYDYFTHRVERFDGDHFCLFTEAYFANGIKQTPKSVLKTWHEDFFANELNAAKPLIDKALAQFRQAGVYLRHLKPPAHNQPSTADDYRLYANKDFEAGQAVEIYAGLWDPTSNAKGHSLSDIQTNQIRGYLPFATKVGVPNVVMVQFFNRMGVSQGFFAMAIRPIKMGEEIVRERLPMEDAAEIYEEKDPSMIDAILESTKLENLSDSLKEGFDLRHIRNRAMAQFLADNPSVIIRLLAEQKITMDEYRRFAFLINLRLERITDGAVTNVFYSLTKAMELVLAQPLHREFFATKARAGKHRLLLHMFDKAARIAQAQNEIELETLWILYSEEFCSIPGNQGLKSCQNPAQVVYFDN